MDWQEGDGWKDGAGSREKRAARRGNPVEDLDVA